MPGGCLLGVAECGVMLDVAMLAVRLIGMSCRKAKQ